MRRGPSATLERGRLLQKLGYLTRDVEDLELEELQGAQGLRALRVAVDLTSRDANAPAPAIFPPPPETPPPPDPLGV